MKKLTHTSLVAALCILTTPLMSFGAETIMQESPDFDTGTSSSDVYGLEKGYFHPFMAVTFEESNNIYNTAHNTLNDWKTVYSPGIWVALPSQKEIHLDLNSNNTSPGGHYQQLNKQEGFDRYQAYLLYAADIEEYYDYTDRNNVSQSAEGFFQLNLRSGLSFDFFNTYSDAEDPAGTGDSTTIDSYKSNMAGIIADYQITEKVRARLDYTNYYLSYDDIVNQGRDRTDNAYSIYSFYDFSDKTSFLVQYEYIDLNYDNYSIQDSEQQSFYVGMNWAPTTKTTIKGKVGMFDRKSDAYNADNTPYVMELSVNWKMTEKSEFDFFASHKANESTISTAAYSKDSTLRCTFNQMLTEKITFNLYVDYTRVAFQGGTGLNRSDDTYIFAPSIQYFFKEWLLGEVGFTRQDRDSSDNRYDYINNSGFIRLSVGI